MKRKEGKGQMDFFRQQDVAEGNFVPSKEDQKWLLEQSGEKVKRLIDPLTESAQRNIIARKYLEKVKKDLEEKTKE